MDVFLEQPYMKKITTVVSAAHTVKRNPAIVVDDNIFYPGGGGQPADKGRVGLVDGRVVMVNRVLKQQGLAVLCLSQRADVQVGDAVTAEIDWERRYHFMRYHTGAHVLMSAIRRNSSNYSPRGIEIAEDGSCCRVLFSASWGQDNSSVQMMQDAANAVINENRGVKSTAYATLADAKSEYASLYRGPEDLEGPVRVVVVDGWDANPCGGTHVGSLSEVGPLVVNSSSSDCLSFSILGKRPLTKEGQ